MKSKRFCTFILAWMLFLGGVGTIPCAMTESAGETSKETETEEINPAKYPNILVPLDEWKFKFDEIPFNEIAYGVSKIDGRTVVLPVFLDQISYIKSENTATKKLSEKDIKTYKENYEKIKENFSSDQRDIMVDYDNLYVTFEVSSLQEIAYNYVDNKTGVISVFSKDFISNIKYYTTMYTYPFPNIIDFLDIDEDSFEIPEDILSGDKKISREEYVEIYKRVIPREYWPIVERKKININSTIPKIKEEKLDMPVKKLKFSQIIKDNQTQYLLTILDTKGNEINFISGEIIEETDSHYYIINNTICDIAFEAEFGQKGIKAVALGLPDYFDDFVLVKTYRDAIDFIQKFPIEEQFDYSVFDLSGNPDIDPAWLANRPTPAPTPVPTPTPTLPPYVELRIGSSGQEVLDMKQRFYELSYFRTNLFSDQFNANTADTVRLFEKSNGLPVDGVADAVMLGVLFSDSAVRK